MSQDAFARIDRIEGESTDSEYTGWIEITDFGLAVRQTVSATKSSAGGASAERADFSRFHFRKQVDTSSPLLALACAAGTHINEIIVVLCRAGQSKVKFMEYRMTDCMISKVRTYAGDGYGFAFPTESVGVDFGKIQLCYVQQGRKGGDPVGNIACGWDLLKNCRV